MQATGTRKKENNRNIDGHIKNWNIHLKKKNEFCTHTRKKLSW